MRDEINNIICDFMKFLIESKLLNQSGNISIMSIISEIDRYHKNELLFDYFMQSCKDLKYNIENKEFPYSIGMIGGLGQYIFSINTFSKKTGNLLNFNKELHLYYCNYVLNVFKFYVVNKKSSYLNYDVINGAAGILYYLLENRDILKNDEIILYLIEYLSNINLCNKIDNGNILVDFGMAHGMIGILVSLSRAYSKGYQFKNQINMINKILRIYEQFKKTKKGTVYFPSTLYYDEFRKFNFEITREERNYTWCYGSITILRALVKSYRYIGNQNKANYYTKLLIKNLNKNASEYKLIVPIICHGYSSVINIVKSFIRDNYFNNKYLKVFDIENYFINKIIDEINGNDLKTYLNRRFNNDISFLQGFGGVILTLNRYIQDDVTFDKLLLID